MSSASPMPLVSVVMPVYDGAGTLRVALESVAAQRYAAFECIVLDNCSSDDTGAIAAEFAARDPRFRCERNTEVLPVMQNHNTVVALMSPQAQYCQILQADDALEPECLVEKVRLAQAHPEIGLVACYSLWGDARFPGKDVGFTESYLTGRDAAARVLRGAFYPFLSPSAVLLRADLVRARGDLYDESVLHGDVKAAYELLEQSDFGFVHQVLVRVGRSARSVTSRVNAPLNRNLAANLELVLTYGPRFLSPEGLQRSVRDHLRQYHSQLARAALEGRTPEYWEFHRKALADAGHPLRGRHLVRAVAVEFWRRPQPSMRRLARRWRPAKEA